MLGEVSPSTGQVGWIWHASDQLPTNDQANLTTISDHDDT